jgi:hypothetical protein
MHPILSRNPAHPYLSFPSKSINTATSDSTPVAIAGSRSGAKRGWSVESLSGAGLQAMPRIQKRDAQALEMLNVAGDQRQPVDLRRGGEEGVQGPEIQA